MERRILLSALKKTERYLKLTSELLVKEWTVFDFTFEIGALGFVGNSTINFLSKLGFSATQKSFMIKRMCLIARHSSFFI